MPTSLLAREWSAWVPLDDASRNLAIPGRPGLYRIRRVGAEQLDYIGQTGLSLRRRLGMLRGVYREQMPYRDPHTAGPGLWALRHQLNCDFEVSGLPIEGEAVERMGFEAAAIALYRQQFRQSPTLNFGRMPAGYRISSGNTARLAAAGRRFIGGPSTVADQNHQKGVGPVGPLDHNPTGPHWCGHNWSPWFPRADLFGGLPDGEGLYRLARSGDSTLLYIGQGEIAKRIRQHTQKGSAPGHRQGSAFADEQLVCSFVETPSALRHQREELETDLIGGHVLTTGRPPAVQFLG